MRTSRCKHARMQVRCPVRPTSRAASSPQRCERGGGCECERECVRGVMRVKLCVRGNVWEGSPGRWPHVLTMSNHGMPSCRAAVDAIKAISSFLLLMATWIKKFGEEGHRLDTTPAPCCLPVFPFVSSSVHRSSASQPQRASAPHPEVAAAARPPLQAAAARQLGV